MTSNTMDSVHGVGVALVGAGFAASFHAENYRRVHGVGARLVGVYSRRPEASREFATQHGVDRTYGDLDELLRDPGVDLVDVCAPNSFHEELVVRALGAGKHVVVEKPFHRRIYAR